MGATPTGNQVEGGVAPGEVLGTLPLGPTPTVTFALPSGSFYLRVRSFTGGVLSGVSNEILAHVNVPQQPSPPAGLLGLVVGNTVSLAWKNTLAGGAPAAVMLDVTGAATLSVPLGLADTFSFAGVPPGTYTIAVRAVNGVGSSVSRQCALERRDADVPRRVHRRAARVRAERVWLLRGRVGHTGARPERHCRSWKLQLQRRRVECLRGQRTDGNTNSEHPVRRAEGLSRRRRGRCRGIRHAMAIRHAPDHVAGA